MPFAVAGADDEMEKGPRRADPEERRRSSFKQRSGTLFTKARSLAEDFGSHVAVVAFSPTGEPHAFGAPTTESVLRTYLPAAAPPAPTSLSPGGETAGEAGARVARMRRATEETKALVKEELARVAAALGKVKAAQASGGKRNWWEVDVDALGEEDLPGFIAALELLREGVQGRIDALASGRPLLPWKGG
ncbi:hypothetical protein ACP70R_044360 [Stipagrostis hirtigluma subsp. patula]